MTTQTKNSIQFSDILAFSFECPDCHSQMAVPLKSFRRVPTFCVNCNKELDHPHTRPVQAAFDRLDSAIREVEEVAKTRKLAIFIEISGEEKQAGKE